MTVRDNRVDPRVDLFWCGVAFVAGFAFAVLVDARPGEQVRARDVPVTSGRVGAIVHTFYRAYVGGPPDDPE